MRPESTPRVERRVLTLPPHYKFSRPSPGQSQFCIVHAPPERTPPWYTVCGRRRPLKRTSLKARLAPWRLCGKCRHLAPLTPALLAVIPPIGRASFYHDLTPHPHSSYKE